MTSWFKLDKHLQDVGPRGRRSLQGEAVTGSTGVEGQGPSVISVDGWSTGDTGVKPGVLLQSDSANLGSPASQLHDCRQLTYIH